MSSISSTTPSLASTTVFEDENNNSHSGFSTCNGPSSESAPQFGQNDDDEKLYQAAIIKLLICLQERDHLVQLYKQMCEHERLKFYLRIQYIHTVLKEIELQEAIAQTFKTVE